MFVRQTSVLTRRNHLAEIHHLGQVRLPGRAPCHDGIAACAQRPFLRTLTVVPGVALQAYELHMIADGMRLRRGGQQAAFRAVRSCSASGAETIAAALPRQPPAPD